MFEFHGWVTLRDSPGESDDEELHNAVDRVREKLAEIAGSPGLMDLRWVNGAAQIHFAGHLNHRGIEGDEIIDLLRYIARIAPGSYGLLYVHDDEDLSGHHNEFRVFVLRRAQVTEHSDPFLSPVMPTIEDDW